MTQRNARSSRSGARAPDSCGRLLKSN